jgi:hypothetical protein
VLTSSGRHELACNTCGAPLRNLKMLPKTAPGQGGRTPQLVARNRPVKKSSRNKFRVKKSRWADLFDDMFDIVEDIFD